ncbi:MAG: outer membrane lipoprotein-sorting protein [Gammaproteobacteria bacterium]
MGFALGALSLLALGSAHAVASLDVAAALKALETTLAAGTPAEQGRAIFEAKDRIDSGYGDLEVELEMILRDRAGSESRRALSISQIEIGDTGERLKVVFTTPVQIRGTALLSYSYADRPDDQWLYLPAVKRVKRIASQNKSGPFLSSEFAFEDMMLQELDKFSYALLGTEACGGQPCWRVERRPHDAFSGYSRQEVLLDAATLRVLGIDYFDRAGRPLKVLRVTDYQLLGERFWKATVMAMQNLQTGKSTELRWRDYRLASGLSAERDFTTNSLVRAR